MEKKREIGHPLPGRKTIVVSGSAKYEGENICTVRSVEEAIFPEFDADAFDIVIGETLGEKIKYTRTVYRRK